MPQQEKLTFGVELEFLLFYTPEGGRVPEPTGSHDKKHGPVLVVPRTDDAGHDLWLWEETWDQEAPERPTELTQFGSAWVTEQVGKTIEAAGVRVGGEHGEDTAVVDPKDEGPWVPYVTWAVDRDESVKIPQEAAGELYPGLHRDYFCFPMEVQSPALSAADAASFAEVARVTDAIRTGHLTATPPSAGLHVHVGSGAGPGDRVSLHMAQRMGALLYAAESVLSQTHPSCRQGNPFCPPLRIDGGVATGQTAAEIKESMERWGLELERQASPHAPLPAKNPTTAAAIKEPTTFQRQVKRGEAALLEERCATKCYAQGWGFIEYDPDDHAIDESYWEPPQYNTELLQGVDEVLRCLDAGIVGRLLSGWRARGGPTYKFANLLPLDADGWAAKNTIEFRQAAASLSGPWVATWARICAGLARWARTAEDDDFFRLVFLCDAGEKDAKAFDVFDLLVETGLEDEAAFLQDRLMGGHHVDEVLGLFSMVTMDTGTGVRVGGKGALFAVDKVTSAGKWVWKSVGKWFGRVLRKI